MFLIIISFELDIWKKYSTIQIRSKVIIYDDKRKQKCPSRDLVKITSVCLPSFKEKNWPCLNFILCRDWANPHNIN